MSTIEALKSAITNRKVLRIKYAPGARLIEPHCLGRSKDGNILLRAFQTEGASESGEHVNWKLLRVDRMSTFEDTGKTFAGPRPQYNPADKAMKGGVIASL
jgi:predicted DNA-binding transcriptional regulator YafY